MPQRTPDRTKTPFELWAKQEGIPIIRGYAVKDMYQAPLGEWKRKGGLGAMIILEGGEGWTAAYVCEIPPKTSLKPQRHFFEERIYVLKGQGETRVWADGIPEQKFAWQEYSLFSPPLNTWHQHINTGKEPARYVAVTNAPLVFNLMRDPEFIYNCDYVFKSRYNGEKGYFDGIAKVVDEQFVKAGFIRDVHQIETLPSALGRITTKQLDLSYNTTSGHIGVLEPGTYKSAHRHWGGAHIIIAQGTGYSLMWDDSKNKVRIDWQKGSICCPPEMWWHQHFNTGKERMIHIALRRGMEESVGKVYVIGKGADQIEYKDEEPDIKKMFERELAKKGLKSNM